MNGYIEFEFKLNGDKYEVVTEYTTNRLYESDIEKQDDVTVYNLINNADIVIVKDREVNREDLVEMLDDNAIVTDLAVGEYDLYEEWSEQIDVDDFIEHTESVIIW